jgi:uncharacterized protein YjdB
LTFTATVQGTNSPAQGASWSVSGGAAGTSISGGLLSVGLSETTGAVLTVTAISSADTGKSGTAKVTVSAETAAVTNVTINPPTASVARGGTLAFTAAVTGTGNPAATVTWSVSPTTGGSTVNGGVLSVAAGEAVGATLTVTAASTITPAKTATATVTVTAAAPTVTSVSVSPATARVAAGGTQAFTASVEGNNNPLPTVTWSVSGGSTGTSVSTAGLLTVAQTEVIGATLTVKAVSTINTGKNDTAEVTVIDPLANILPGLLNTYGSANPASPGNVPVPSVIINTDDTSATGVWKTINSIVQTAGKYVVLNLSSCTVTGNAITGTNPPAPNNFNIIAGNTYIKGIVFPATLATIGSYACYECTHLTDVTIPGSVTSIGDRAFNACSSLTTVIFGTDSDITTEWQKSAFGTSDYDEYSGTDLWDVYNTETKPGKYTWDGGTWTQ